MTGSDVSHVSGSMFYACATGSCAISALVRPFSQEVTKSRDRKRSCPALLFFPRTFFPRIFPPYFFSRIFFPYFFFSSSSTSCWFGVFSATSASYDHRKLPPLLFSYIRCSLRRPRPITIGNYSPLFIFIN